jgi:CheY-like chemotaxis protein
VTSAESALEQLRQGAVDLVITDLRLPGRDGRSLARRVLAGRRPLPVIVLTAYGGAEVLEELQSYGVHAVFPKPFRVDQIRRTVRDALASATPARRPALSGRGREAGRMGSCARIWRLSESARLHLFLSRAESLRAEDVAHLLGCSVEAAQDELRQAEEALAHAMDSILAEERKIS